MLLSAPGRVDLPFCYMLIPHLIKIILCCLHLIVVSCHTQLLSTSANSEERNAIVGGLAPSNLFNVEYAWCMSSRKRSHFVLPREQWVENNGSRSREPKQRVLKLGISLP